MGSFQFFFENSQRYLWTNVYHQCQWLPVEQWSLVSLSGVRGVYWSAFSWRIQWHYRRLCPTSVAGDIAILVWSSMGGLRGLWSGCVRCLFMCLFMAVPMTSSAGVSDPGGRRYYCLLAAVFLFLLSGSQFCRKNRPLSSQQFIAGVNKTGHKIFPQFHWNLPEIIKKHKLYRKCQRHCQKNCSPVSTKLLMNFSSVSTTVLTISSCLSPLNEYIWTILDNR